MRALTQQWRAMPGKLMRVGAISVALACSASAWAQGPSPEGVWRTIDDETGAAKSLVRISATGSTYTGVVEQVLVAGKEDARCDACQGELANQPIRGMRILWGVRANDDEYGGGEILDPANGKTYKVKMWFEGDPNVLTVRGYIGLPLLGRSQVWQRVQ